MTASPTSASTSTRCATWPAEHRPKMIVAGATAYPRIIDPAPFREIADEVGALFMFDAAHIAGLIAGGVHPNPVPYADVVTFTTHKTLRGPRGGCILCRAEHAAAIDKAVFPGLQGGPLDHVIAAKAVAFREAADPSSPTTPGQIVANAAALAERARRPRLPPGVGRHRQPPACWSTCAAFDEDLSGKKARRRSTGPASASTRTPSPTTPGRPSSPAALRIGTPAVTTQGMGEAEMARSRDLIHRVLTRRDDEAVIAGRREQVAELCAKFAPYPDGGCQPSRRRIGPMRSAQRRTARTSAGARAARPTPRWPTSSSSPSPPPHLRCSPPSCGGWRRASARWPSPTSGAVHAAPTPYLGGVAMFVGLPRRRGRGVAHRRFDADVRRLPEPLGVVLAAGRSLRRWASLDDVRDVSAPAKIAGHGAGGQRPVLFGVSMLYLPRPVLGGLSCSSPDLAPLRDGPVGAWAWPTPSTSSTASTAWPPASWPSPPARSSSTGSSWRLDDVVLRRATSAR